jgi:hypothetical protein
MRRGHVADGIAASTTGSSTQSARRLLNLNGGVFFFRHKGYRKEAPMPIEIKGTNLVKVTRGTGQEVVLRDPRKAELGCPDDIAPMPSTQLVSDEDKRFEEAMALTAEDPTDAIRGSGRSQPPLIKGARVPIETILCCLEALAKLSVENVKVTFRAGEEPKILIEGGTSNIWTAVVIPVESTLKNGFEALLPITRAINVLRRCGSRGGIVIGVDKGGFCLGAYSVPFGGKVSKFQSSPVALAPSAAAAIPGFYCGEIADRVASATHPKTIFGSLHTVLLDFDVHELDGKQIVVGTAVATDGCRMHILQLPRIVMKLEGNTLPPAIRIAPGFFSYLKDVVSSEWTVLELRHDQVVARGEDLMVIATATVEKRNAPSEASLWREVSVSYGGCWMVESSRLEELLEAADGEYVNFKMDSMYEEIIISSTAKDGSRYEEQDSKHARCLDGPSTVKVVLDRKYFLDAVRAASSKLVRLEFEHDMDKQASSPVMVRGEDEQFRAIVMPVTKEEENASM